MLFALIFFQIALQKEKLLEDLYDTANEHDAMYRSEWAERKGILEAWKSFAVGAMLTCKKSNVVRATNVHL